MNIIKMLFLHILGSAYVNPENLRLCAIFIWRKLRAMRVCTRQSWKNS